MYKVIKHVQSDQIQSVLLTEQFPMK